MLVRLLHGQPLAKDGIRVTRHEVGEIIDLSPALASALLRDGHAESAIPPHPEPELDSVLAPEPLVAPPSEEPSVTPKKKYRNRGDQQ